MWNETWNIKYLVRKRGKVIMKERERDRETQRERQRDMHELKIGGSKSINYWNSNYLVLQI